ncbi:MAG: metal ABC transporter solute-binding protein, Zn/Mn family [Granulosicoccaceae bacterium]
MLLQRFILLLGLLIAAPLQAQVKVSVGIDPMRYLLEQIGGERVLVSTLLSSGDPHALDPTPAQLLALKKSDLYFAVGLPFERSLGKRLGAPERLVWLAAPDQEHLENHAHDHSDLSLDPHRWASPREMLRMAVQVVAKLQSADPAGTDFYAEQLLQFRVKVEQLQSDLAKALEGKPQAFVAIHPAWGWFAEEFDLLQLAVEREGKLPSIRQMSELKKDIVGSGAQAVVSEQGGNQAQVLAQRLGLKLLVANPLSLDWEGSLRSLAQGLSEP